MFNRLYKTYSFRGGGQSEKNVESVHFQYFNPFFFTVYHFYGKLSIWKMLVCTHFDWEGSVKMYVLYTQLNVDNYGQLLSIYLDGPEILMNELFLHYLG